jgi:hypothetical protein
VSISLFSSLLNHHSSPKSSAILWERCRKTPPVFIFFLLRHPDCEPKQKLFKSGSLETSDYWLLIESICNIYLKWVNRRDGFWIGCG